MDRRILIVHGVVQGVGFRPFVHRLARRYRLGGYVRNEIGSVRIEAEGPATALDRFETALRAEAPAAAAILRIDRQFSPPGGERTFRIAESSGEAPSDTFLSPDRATCADCLAELFDPNNRRYRYPFINCTACGPRLSIITGAPYDRARTTMAAFRLCRQCRAEYDDPSDRRFHAEATACRECGPRLELADSAGRTTAAADPLAEFAEALLSGRIGALKGLGGYHLVCDARNARAVAALRERKQRDEKPLAVMVNDAAAAEAWCRVSAAERKELESSARPIGLLDRRDDAATRSIGDYDGGPCEGVAPGRNSLGVMLPYTPLHHLLMEAVSGIPLVMTSGNRSDEPIAYDDSDAARRLAGIADLFLRHDRPIHRRCDDSVVRVVGEAAVPVRRSRGYAPAPMALPVACPEPLLAVGGHLKNAFAVARGDHGVLSQHIGDLDTAEAYEALVRDVGDYERLFGITPRAIAHDLHPDYGSTDYARRRAATEGLRLIGVQHHEAHAAAVMAEHGLTEPVIAVVFDGTGWGECGPLADDEQFASPTAVWGGEFLVGDYRSFRRAARFRYVPLAGGDRAAREPWRMAVAHLIDAGLEPQIEMPRLPAAAVRTIGSLVRKRVQAPPTSSIGRLFDAAASLAGLCDRATYEAQAASQLEEAAAEAPADGSYAFAVQAAGSGRPEGDGPLVVDTRPWMRGMAEDVRRGVDVPQISRRFHATLAEVVADICRRLRDATGVDAVVLGGGSFINRVLTQDVVERLARDGFRVYRPRLVPPGDGGLCLGQIVVAAAMLAAESERYDVHAAATDPRAEFRTVSDPMPSPTT